MNQQTLLDRIYGVIGDPARWPEVLAAVSDHIGGIGGQLIYNAPPGRKNLMVLAGLDPQYSVVYHKYHVWNPWTVAAKNQPFGEPFVAGSLVDPRVIDRTAFYADVLAPQKIRDMVIINHRSLALDGGVGGLGFALSARAIDSAERIRRRLRSLAPHLCRALDASLRLGPMADGSRHLATLLQTMPGPALLLDVQARIVGANPAAERLLRNTDGLVRIDDKAPRLAAPMAGEAASLARALKKTLGVVDGSGDEPGGPVRLTRRSAEAPLLVLPMPLPPPAFPFWELSQSARMLVLIVDPAMRNPAAASLLQRAFGLTDAEARVAALVGSGASRPQAARALGISPETVKTHLARCFAKTGTRSQVELARIVSALPGASVDRCPTLPVEPTSPDRGTRRSFPFDTIAAMADEAANANRKGGCPS